MGKRLIAIDYIKCLACVLIINSHLTSLYPRQLYFLSMGGYFGNSLFFFSSGYCLAHIKGNFLNWYRRRFTRVYIPYLCMLPLLFFAGWLKGLDFWNIIMPFEKFHFIPTILILYIPFYLLSWLDHHTRYKYRFTFLILFIITLLYFFFIFDYQNENVIGHFKFTEMCFYLMIMLLGAIQSQGKGLKEKKALAVICFITLSIYTFQSFRHFSGSFVILKPITGILFSYCLACIAIEMNDILHEHRIIKFVSMLTLEAYLTHYISIDAFRETGFPTNIIYVCVSAFGVAYCLHIIDSKVIKKAGDLTRRVSD